MGGIRGHRLARLMLATLCLWLSHAHAQNLQRINFVIDSMLQRHTVSANILIATDSKILFERNMGFADIATARPLQKSNAFQIASLSKQFTAYGIMVLKHQGLLDYDSALRRYLPEFPYPTITIRHLLSHTSGLPSFTGQILPHLDTTHSNGNVELLRYLSTAQLPLQSQPGKVFEYADIGYDLLATAIERISGKTYRQFMHQQVFRPARMFSTTAEMVTDIRRIKNKRLAVGHIFDSIEHTFVPAHSHPSRNLVFYLGDFYGDGSVVSTSFDLFIWHRMLTRGLLLPQDVQQEAFAPYKVNGALPLTASGRAVSYGFGWVIGQDEAMGTVLSHGGGHPGFTSYYYRFPQKKLCLVFLSNAETPANSYLRNRLLALLKE
jgi:CubicO group peptidase (beta-lactamase class C family)